MRIRPYQNKDFNAITQWITDERSHALWCANLMPYPLEKKEFDNVIRNKGYGSEMLRLAIKYAFEIAKADAVQLNVFPENHGAKKCYEKVGFKERTLTESAFSYKEELWGRCNMVISR